jgi:hypothetical protein
MSNDDGLFLLFFFESQTHTLIIILTFNRLLFRPTNDIVFIYYSLDIIKGVLEVENKQNNSMRFRVM